MVTASDKPIVLLGFMGSGKSTLGKQLASALGWTFVDLDRFIETRENKTIPEIFERQGEPAFRMIESNALKEVLGYHKQVIAVGGGAPCRQSNLDLIRGKALSVYLKISEAELFRRLTSSSTSRPLLKGKSVDETAGIIKELITLREPFYNQADVIIESDAVTCEIILSRL